MKKVCFKCKKEKFLTEFVKHKYKKSGRGSPCYKCKRIMDREYHRIARRTKKVDKTEEYRKYYKNNLEKVRAHATIRRAVVKGKLKKLSCAICKLVGNSHGHHSDYSKPLEVIWLCPLHHKQIHK